MRTFERIFVHTTSASYKKVPKQFHAVNRWHKDRFGFYFNEEEQEWVGPSSFGYFGGYTILIEPDGAEFRFREDREETMAVLGWNRKSLSVALAFDGDIEMPTSAQMETLKKRLKKWCDKYNIPSDKVEFVSPHRMESKNKTCFGSLLPDDWAVKLLHPVQKDAEDQAKKDNTEAQASLILDQIRRLTLQLKILVGKYIKLVNQRTK